MVLPAMFEVMNMSIPSLKSRISKMLHAERNAALSNLPSPSSVRRPPGVIGIFLILQYVGFSLQREAQ